MARARCAAMNVTSWGRAVIGRSSIVLSTALLGCAGNSGEQAASAGASGSVRGGAGGEASSSAGSSGAQAGAGGSGAESGGAGGRPSMGGTSAGEGGADAGGSSDVDGAGVTGVDNSSAGAAGSAGAGGVDSGAQGGASAGAASGCRSTIDCPAETFVPNWVVWYCVGPYDTPPESYISGIPPGWCGSTNCGPTPTGPTGSNMTCGGPSDCPAPSSTTAVASICFSGRCTECATSSDCPAARPICNQVSLNSTSVVTTYNACVACAADSDCPSAHPRCVAKPGSGGTCADCKSNDDCADGVCAIDSGTCVPGCTKDADCGDPAKVCSGHHRCEAVACSATTTCPTYTACRNGTCQRIGCASDADCPDGFCVSGTCQESLGQCMSQSRGA